MSQPVAFAPLHDDRLWRDYMAAAEQGAEPGTLRHVELTAGNAVTSRARAQHFGQLAYASSSGGVPGRAANRDHVTATQELRGACREASQAHMQAQQVMEVDLMLFEVENSAGACIGRRKSAQQGRARTAFETWSEPWGINVKEGFRARFGRLNRENREWHVSELHVFQYQGRHEHAAGRTHTPTRQAEFVEEPESDDDAEEHHYSDDGAW